MVQLTLHLVNGSVGFNFSPEAGRELKAALNQLVDRLKVSASKPAPGTKATPQPPLEYRQTDEVFLELFCNPNIYPTLFAAKVLVTLKTDRVRLSVEAELSQVIEDVNQFLEQVS